MSEKLSAPMSDRQRLRFFSIMALWLATVCFAMIVVTPFLRPAPGIALAVIAAMCGLGAIIIGFGAFAVSVVITEMRRNEHEARPVADLPGSDSEHQSRSVRKRNPPPKPAGKYKPLFELPEQEPASSAG